MLYLRGPANGGLTHAELSCDLVLDGTLRLCPRQLGIRCRQADFRGMHGKFAGGFLHDRSHPLESRRLGLLGVSLGGSHGGELQRQNGGRFIDVKREPSGATPRYLAPGVVGQSLHRQMHLT